MCLRLSRANRHVALKMLTAESYGGGKDIYELSILRHIKTANPDHPGYKHVVCLLDEFGNAGPHDVRVCLVFEVMAESAGTPVLRREATCSPGEAGRQTAVTGARASTPFMQGRSYGSVVPLHNFCLLTKLYCPLDIQPRSIMIQLENAESVIRDHRERHPHEPSGPDDVRPSGAYYFSFEALTKEIPHSTSDINIKIVDFGVGM